VGDSRFFAGAAGWDHPEWQGAFYPDGLPEDWRLAYYAHFYPAALIPRPVWSTATSEMLTAWARDTPPHFRFLLALVPEESRDKAFSAGSRLGGKFQGCVAGGQPVPAATGLFHCIWLSQVPDLRALAREVRDAREFPGPVFLLEDARDLKRLRDASLLLEALGLSAA
jgi:hypothetical protein